MAKKVYPVLTKEIEKIVDEALETSINSSILNNTLRGKVIIKAMDILIEEKVREVLKGR